MESLSIRPSFVIGKYISNSYFCARENETKFLIKQIENGCNITLISLRHFIKARLKYQYFHQEWILQNYYIFSLVFIPLLRILNSYVGKAVYEELRLVESY